MNEFQTFSHRRLASLCYILIRKRRSEHIQ